MKNKLLFLVGIILLCLFAMKIANQYFFQKNEMKKVKNSKCDCIPEIKGDYADSSHVVNMEDNSYGDDLKLSVDSKYLEDLLNAEIKSNVNANKYKINTRNIYNQVIDKYPEITNYDRFKRDYFCAFVRIICVDSTLSSTEFRKLKTEKLNETEKAIEAIYLENISNKRKGRNQSNKRTASKSITVTTEGDVSPAIKSEGNVTIKYGGLNKDSNKKKNKVIAKKKSGQTTSNNIHIDTKGNQSPAIMGEGNVEINYGNEESSTSQTDTIKNQ